MPKSEWPIAEILLQMPMVLCGAEWSQTLLEDDGCARLKYSNPINRTGSNEAKTEVERDERDNAKAKKIQERIEGTREESANTTRNETKQNEMYVQKGRGKEITYQ